MNRLRLWVICALSLPLFIAMGGMPDLGNHGSGIGLAKIGTAGLGGGPPSVEINRCDGFRAASDDITDVASSLANAIHAARMCTVASDEFSATTSLDVTMWTMSGSVNVATSASKHPVMRCLRPALIGAKLDGVADGKHVARFEFVRVEVVHDFTDSSTHLGNLKAQFPASMKPTCISMRRATPAQGD